MFESQSSTSAGIPEVSLHMQVTARSRSLPVNPLLTNDHLMIKTKVESFHHDGVIWMLMNEYGLKQDESETLFNDMKHFLFAAYVVSEKMNLIPSNRVDLAWHCFLLHTRDYISFCNEMFGQIMHHEPINARVDASKCGCCDSSCGITREGERDERNFASPEETMQVITNIFGQALSSNWSYAKMEKAH